MLKIERVYNNNVVQASNEEGRELIVMGRGLGFQKKAGDWLEEDQAEKTFVLQNDQQLTDLKQIFGSLSQEEIHLVNALIRRAEEVLDTSFELSLYVSLADHLHFVLERAEQGLALENPLAWEIRKFYPKEYQLGLESLELIRERLGKILDGAEASSIALHLVNAQRNGAMGKGIAIDPSDGILVSPANAKVTLVFPTKHAIGLQTENGAEILIHVGMDTVSLAGKGFKSFAEVGDEVKAGQKLLEFDINAIKEAGLPVTTPIVVTNTEEFTDILVTQESQVNSGDYLLTVVK